MFDRYKDADNPLEEPAIVLIDEIDLHLHPKWMIVQSTPEDANLVLLKKEQDHVAIDQNVKNVHN
jgi:hypothetical protein